jgi:hypothetical protein
MTALPKTDTNCTALSLMPTITGGTFAASLRTDICPQRKESSSTSHARNPFNLNFFDSAQCLMVRRWRLLAISLPYIKSSSEKHAGVLVVAHGSRYAVTRDGEDGSGS